MQLERRDRANAVHDEVVGLPGGKRDGQAEAGRARLRRNEVGGGPQPRARADVEVERDLPGQVTVRRDEPVHRLRRDVVRGALGRARRGAREREGAGQEGVRPRESHDRGDEGPADRGELRVPEGRPGPHEQRPAPQRDDRVHAPRGRLEEQPLVRLPDRRDETLLHDLAGPSGHGRARGGVPVVVEVGFEHPEGGGRLERSRAQGAGQRDRLLHEVERSVIEHEGDQAGDEEERGVAAGEQRPDALDARRLGRPDPAHVLAEAADVHARRRGLHAVRRLAQLAVQRRGDLRALRRVLAPLDRLGEERRAELLVEDVAAVGALPEGAVRRSPCLRPSPPRLVEERGARGLEALLIDQRRLVGEPACRGVLAVAERGPKLSSREPGPRESTRAPAAASMCEPWGRDR